MPYTDVNFYKTIYPGKRSIPDANIEAYLQRASDCVDQMTQSRIVTIGFDNLTPFQQTQVKLATCLQAEHIFDLADIPEGVESISNNGNTISLPKGKKLYSQAAKAQLIPSGLMYRGL